MAHERRTDGESVKSVPNVMVKCPFCSHPKGKPEETQKELTEFSSVRVTKILKKEFFVCFPFFFFFFFKWTIYIY